MINSFAAVWSRVTASVFVLVIPIPSLSPIELADLRSSSICVQTLHAHLKAIPILHEVGATWLLPVAYYRVGTYESESFLETGEPWDALPVDKKLSCALLHPHHVHATNTINSFLANRSACSDADPCNAFKEAYLEDLLTREDVRCNLRPLKNGRMLSGRMWGMVNCVTPVAPEPASNCHDTAALVIWSKLPGNCGLEDWDSLKENRALALS
ncbi:hypothetical protein C8R44DRAFT_728443 [Mycena epipterygia]|nr:hypothetical protein C8R44DRAFT_728443 [Mycena epipterygia]